MVDILPLFNQSAIPLPPPLSYLSNPKEKSIRQTNKQEKDRQGQTTGQTPGAIGLTPGLISEFASVRSLPVLKNKR